MGTSGETGLWSCFLIEWSLSALRKEVSVFPALDSRPFIRCLFTPGHGDIRSGRFVSVECQSVAPASTDCGPCSCVLRLPCTQPADWDQKSVLSGFWGPEVWNQAVGLALLVLSCKGRILPASSSFWWLLAIRGIPWLVDTSLQSLLLSSHPFLLFCVSVFSCLLSYDIDDWI